MKFTSIRFKMLLNIAIILVLSFSISGSVYYYEMKTFIESDVMDSTNDNLQATSNTVITYLDNYAKGVKLWALNYDAYKIEEKAINWQFLNNKFKDYRTVNPSTEMLYVGTESGKMFTEPKADLPADFDPRQREWYKRALENPDEAIWTDPYITADGSKKMIITVAKAVIDPATQKPTGVLGADISLDALMADFKNIQAGFGGYVFLLDPKGVALVHPTLVGENLNEKYDFIKQIYDANEKEGMVSYQLDNADKVLAYHKIDGLNWIIGFAYEADAIYAKLYEIRNLVLLVFGITLIASIVISYFGATRVTNPLVQLTKLMGRVASGDLTVKASVKGKDEVAQLGNYFNQMTDQMSGLIQQVVVTATDVSSSAAQLSVSSNQAVNTSEEVTRTIGQVAAGSVNQAEQSEVGHEKMNQLAEAIEHFHEASKKMSDLSQSVTQANTEGMRQVANLKQKTNENMDVMASIGQAINSLDSRAKEISVIINVITDIANQTSLLALNAAIEAARAGEHGKGFAVVAGEVQKLAAQSNSAAEDIRHRIEAIQQEADRAASEMSTKGRAIAETQYVSVEDTEKAFADIKDTIQEIVEQVSVFTREVDFVSHAKDGALLAIQHISAVSQEAAAAAEEVTASTEDQMRALQNVQQSAAYLSELSQKLQEATARFTLS
ncbi:methyl-accepting chemotaxis protein [Brevibacillus dissolubilis]|uniref:methyl-accepting chemotaxis protein n=1 Tax=Brevibacillus dissolubilis TaxID=1844116 RepID=UPI001115E774|nr:methyl-accepting chemotaxis protein [Brevibacillus dissolubilis]